MCEKLFLFLFFRERISKTEQLRQQLRASELYDSVQLHAAKGKKPPEYRKKIEEYSGSFPSSSIL
jgi:hypothetical protein